MNEYNAAGIFEWRLRGILNRFNRAYDLRIYNSRKEVPEGFLFSGSGVTKQIEIKVPRYFGRTFFRDAEKSAMSKIKNLARRFDCDIVVLDAPKINGSDPLNPDFDGEKTPRSYKVRASFYSSPDYLNRHSDASLERLRRRRNLRIFQNI